MDSDDARLALDLTARAKAESAGLRPLFVAARAVAETVLPGIHGRRRSGAGYEFWQYRPAEDGDPIRTIDWRRSARSDGLYVREREQQSANTVLVWVDASQSMQFSGHRGGRTKVDQARILALAVSLLLSYAEERVGLLDGNERPRTGTRHLERMALALLEDHLDEYQAPPVVPCPAGSRSVLFSDFLGPWERIEDSIRSLADSRVDGVLVHIIDPMEKVFPFDGCTLFQSVGGGVEFKTLRARGIRESYLSRLEERRLNLALLANELGWSMTSHSTDGSASPLLLWLYGALEGKR